MNENDDTRETDETPEDVHETTGEEAGSSPVVKGPAELFYELLTDTQREAYDSRRGDNTYWLWGCARDPRNRLERARSSRRRGVTQLGELRVVSGLSRGHEVRLPFLQRHRKQLLDAVGEARVAVGLSPGDMLAPDAVKHLVDADLESLRRVKNPVVNFVATMTPTEAALIDGVAELEEAETAEVPEGTSADFQAPPAGATAPDEGAGEPEDVTREEPEEPAEEAAEGEDVTSPDPEPEETDGVEEAEEEPEPEEEPEEVEEELEETEGLPEDWRDRDEEEIRELAKSVAGLNFPSARKPFMVRRLEGWLESQE